MKTRNLTLIPHVPAHLVALRESEETYQKVSGFKAAAGIHDYLLMASPEFFRSLEDATDPDPWRFGFAIFHTAENRAIGLCGYAGPPSQDGCVEIGYSIAPDYQGKGFATEAAEALTRFAFANGGVQTVCAHTMAEVNASTRVLKKCGFAKTKEFTDPEGTLVWRWEKLMTKHE